MALSPKLLAHFSINEEKVVVFDEKINDILSNTIKSNKRVEHSISVANLSYKIALANNLSNPFSFYLAGLFHDLAKGLSKDELKEEMVKHYSSYLDLPSFSYHQFIGGYLTKKLVGIEDKEIIDAIECHCTGKANMSPIDMVVYSADKTDPLRGYDSSKMIESLIKDYYKGFLYVLKENKAFLIKKTNNINSIENRLSKACFEYYLK